MDFAWVVDALRRGLKVTRKAWAGDPPMYLYVTRDRKTEGPVIAMHTGSKKEIEWYPPAALLLDATDWEEYVEPRVRQEGPFVINPLPLTGTMGLHGGQAVEDQSDYAKEARKAIKVGEDTGYMAEQLEMLADIYAEKIGQRVVQLLQKTDVPMSKGDTNHV